ncbi:hypothetical protein ACFYWY_37185 [Streptomyces sp. NPDC002870]|uniref:hypothetical protein n=1 Tax=Streptomyces sp. NPDC002870 TaxID=3364666 RepID=UPI00367CB253
MPSTGGQRSNARDLQAAISALTMADNGLTRIRADVENTKHDLAARFGGGDGGAYGNLITGWEFQANRIHEALNRLRGKLETTLQVKQQEQGANVDSIHQRTVQNEQVFHDLTR